MFPDGPAQSHAGPSYVDRPHEEVADCSSVLPPVRKIFQYHYQGPVLLGRFLRVTDQQVSCRTPNSLGFHVPWLDL